MDLVQAQSWSYMSRIPSEIGALRGLLQTYSEISEDDIDQHLFNIRAKAWNVSQTPSIGRWKFLTLMNRDDELYQEILFRLKLPQSQAAILDLGCGLGQVLRQLRSDGVPGHKLFGTDVSSELIEIGYEMFRDRYTLGATFVLGDMIDPGDNRLSKLQGQITVVIADSFFHLFTWTQQLYIGKRLVGFIKPGTHNATIVGRHAGVNNKSPAAFRASNSPRAEPFLHDQRTFQQLWDEVGKLTSTRWHVESEQDGSLSDQLPGIEPGVVPMRFTIRQIPHK